jgi:hypothetical protein
VRAGRERGGEEQSWESTPVRGDLSVCFWSLDAVEVEKRSILAVKLSKGEYECLKESTNVGNKR